MLAIINKVASSAFAATVYAPPPPPAPAAPPAPFPGPPAWLPQPPVSRCAPQPAVLVKSNETQVVPR